MNRPPGRTNGAVAGAVCGEAQGLWQSNDSAPPQWQQGLSPRQIGAVLDHRRALPDLPLPAELQRDLGRSWREYGARCEQ